MRLHRLRLQAFGPFAGVEEVDFDALSHAGLFLLHGPTGAGKTSVLDAVCFALYGQVPGQRSADRLRSDHAEPGLAPEVTCQFSVGSRRLEVTRSPAWERPKRRGQGTTREQARVLVRELCEGTWQARAQRLDEAGLLLSDLLGMGVDSFTKLVLLPQGEFAAFLRADAEARRSLLERLFGTDRFTAVQGWLKDRRAQVRHDVDAADARTQRFLARADQAAAPVLRRGSGHRRRADDDVEHVEHVDHVNHADDEQLAAQPSAASVPDEPVAHVKSLRATVSWARDDAVAQRAATHERRVRAESELARGRALASAVAERDRLGRHAGELRQKAAEHAVALARLRDHDRCGALVPLVGPLAAAAAERDRAQTRLAALCGDAAERAGEDDGELDALLALARADLGALAAVTGQEQAVPVLRRELEARRAVGAALRGRMDAVREGIAEATAALARTDSGLAQARSGAADLGAVRAAVERTRAGFSAATDRDRRRVVVAGMSTHVAEARRTRDDARERWLDLRERRLAGIAGELAAALVAGEPCRVCGSPDHPAPARPEAGAVTAQQDRAAQKAAEAAAAHLSAAQVELARQNAELDAVVATAAGLDTASAEAAAGRAGAALNAAESATRRVVELEAARTELASALQAARTQEEELRNRLARADEAVAVAEQRLGACLDAVRAGCGEDSTPSARRARLELQISNAEAALSARRRLARARDQLAGLRSSASAAAHAAGFVALEDAVAAVLPGDAAARLAGAAREYEHLSAAVAAGLAREEIAAMDGLEAPDVVALQAAEELAVADDEAAAERETLCRTASEALDAIAGELAAHLAQTAEIGADYRRVDDLARCADGTGGENARRMSLSAYVLAAQLEEVAQAAGVRLSQMSGGRYTLVHCDDVEKGGRRSGLSLHVVDGWTGRQRPTGSLSGGETFYASLALALGLADVLSAEAAGTSIDTLFVDEGFGSLDEDTLDEVMDTLDALRSGGRAVGLVSHVPDLQQRIPARLEVVKRRNGSTLRLSAAS